MLRSISFSLFSGSALNTERIKRTSNTPGKLLECAGNVARSNVKLALGTDLGTFDFSVNGATEYTEMVCNGITPLRALKAGTSVAAEMLDLNTGSITVGKWADLVAMPGNPFEDISVTKK